MKKILIALSIWVLALAPVFAASSQSQWLTASPTGAVVGGSVMMTVNNSNVPVAISPTNPIAITYAGATSVVAGQTVLVAAGTTQPLSATSKPIVNSITIMASSSNSGQIIVGPAGVNNTIGAGGTGFPLASNQSITWYGSNVNAVFINGTNSGDKVSYFGN